MKAFLTWEPALPHPFGCLGCVSNPSANWRKSIHSWKIPGGQSGVPFAGFAVLCGSFLGFLHAFLCFRSPFPGRRDLRVLDTAGAWGRAEPARGWEAGARWGWRGGLQPNVAGTSQPCAGLDWDILAWMGSLLQRGPLQDLLARRWAGVFNNVNACSYQLIAG